MKEINFEIESMVGLKMDNMENIIFKAQPKTDEGYKKQAPFKVYRNEKGNLIIPKKSIKACLREGCKDLVGKLKGKAIEQTIKAFVFFKDDLDLGIKDYDGIVMDIVTRTKGKQQTRVPTYRPLIKSWKAKELCGHL